MEAIPKYITINGQRLSANQCQLKCSEDLPQWEHDVYTFLTEWFDVSETLKVHTSGSTGKPKLINVPKSACVASALNTGYYFQFQSHQKALICLPAKYIAGKMMLVRAIIWQLDATLIEPKIKLDLPKPTFDFTALTPPQCAANIDELNRLGNIIIGGAPISPSLEEQIMQRTSNAFATYGMTETVSHIALRPLGTSAFTALNGVEIGINKQACLWINAPKLHPAKLQTNDMVSMPSGHSFIWKGRADFVINSGGKKLHPEEIERKVSSAVGLPCLVYGVASKKWGEQPALLIEGDNIPNLEDWLSTHLPKHEQPIRISYLKAFKYTANGKIQRHQTLNQMG